MLKEILATISLGAFALGIGGCEEKFDCLFTPNGVSGGDVVRLYDNNENVIKADYYLDGKLAYTCSLEKGWEKVK